MGYFPHGLFIATQQAEERRRRDEQEEEEMTKYTSDQLEGNWEFKIVRSESGAFRKPEVFQALLQEESIAGWELVEKLDDRRVRFKRRPEARRKDITLPPGIDPYRSTYGNATTHITILIIVAALIAIGISVGVLNANTNSESFQQTATELPFIIIGVIFAIMLAVVIKRRR